MKWFNVTNFPNFRKEALNYSGTLDDTMRRMGFKSAKFRLQGPNAWGLSEEEYTWFVLRFS
jgi:protein subunit release factor B